MYKKTLFALACFFPMACFSLTLDLPSKGNSVVGTVHTAVVRSYDDVTALSERHDIGSFELAKANPGKDVQSLIIGEELVVPSRYILPKPYRGIIVNLSELRMYYYPPGTHTVMIFPVGIGKEGAPTPVMKTKIVAKQKNPRWFPSNDTRAEAVAQGIVLPKYVEAGPDNPLGDFAMRLSVPEYLIHGTNDPSGVGLRSSAGCLRMYPEDVQSLYDAVKIGTPVQIINERFKAGWDGNNLELESHVPIDQEQNQPLSKEAIAQLNTLLLPMITKEHAEVNWDKALAVAREELGIPEVIGKRGV